MFWLEINETQMLQELKRGEKMKVLVAGCILGIGLSACGQSTQAGPATASGGCAVSHSGNYDTITIQNCGIGEEQGKKIIKVLNALVQGQESTDFKLDEILQILLKPIKITTSESIAIPAPLGGHPRAAVTFFTDDPVDRGQFEVLCDSACAPADICTLLGQNASFFATVSDNLNVAEFLFQRQFPALTECQLTIESRTDQPVKIISMTTSNRKTNLVPNAVQPQPRVWMNGAIFQ
jgi:hypothetical protein